MTGSAERSGFLDGGGGSFWKGILRSGCLREDQNLRNKWRGGNVMI
jgi:hypothetical protein